MNTKFLIKNILHYTLNKLSRMFLEGSEIGCLLGGYILQFLHTAIALCYILI